MLSPATLNRVSNSYRRGYYDGYERRETKNDPVSTTESGVPLKPFSDHDYSMGYRAGANDRKWADHYAKHAVAEAKRRDTAIKADA